MLQVQKELQERVKFEITGTRVLRQKLKLKMRAAEKVDLPPHKCINTLYLLPKQWKVDFELILQYSSIID